MITPNKIITTMRALLRAAHTGHQDEPYLDEVPQDFHRPSLLIEMVGADRVPTTRWTVRNTEKYRVICFATVDDYGYSNAAELRALQESVMAVFDGGSIPVDDRAPNVAANSATPQADYAVVNITISYDELRQAAQPEHDLMEDVAIDIK